MRRVVTNLLALLIGGLAGAVLPTFIAGSQAQGADVRCIRASGHTICKGHAVTELPWNWPIKFGGVVALSCDFERPGKAKLNGGLIGVRSIVSGCRTARYVVSLSDGGVETNFWIDSGRIVQIDRFNASSIDL